MLRLIPRIFIGISSQRKDTQGIPPLYSPKRYTTKSHFWICRLHSWMKLLVTKLLKGLNPSKALEPDELHPRVLKELAKELGLVFAHLFQLSIKAKIKIIFVSPYPTDPKKMPLPKKFYCNFSYKIIFSIIVYYREAKISCFRRIHCLIMLSMIAF